MDLKNNKRWVCAAALIALLISGCGVNVKTYVKPDVPWDALKKFAVFPFSLPSENPVERQLVTQLFAQELRRAEITELIEVPVEDSMGVSPFNLKKIGQAYGVDAVFTGSVDTTYGTVVHVRLQDVATEDLLWSGSYTLGTRAELFSIKTQQQHLQRAFDRLVGDFTSEAPISISSYGYYGEE